LPRKGGDGSHRSLKQFDFENYPAPGEVYTTITTAPGWPYRYDKETYQVRDRALVALLYLGALRISEALRLTKSQISGLDDPTRIVIRSVLVSKKAFQKGRSNLRAVWLPRTGERSRFTDLFMEWVKMVKTDEERLFKFGRVRAWQITFAMTGKWNHYFRALGEAYLYDRWGADVLAVADYVNVTPAVLTQYIRGAHRKKPSV
jgi:integrase